MKYLNLILTLTVFTSVSHAKTECYDFNVSRNATNLQTVRIAIETKKTTVSAHVTGATDDKKISNNFTCTGAQILSCEHPEGAGDFTIQLENETILKFSYVNLAIGATGPNASKPNEEITEEFAFLDKSPAANDDEEDADHLGEVTLKGSKVSCDSKM